MNTEKFTHGDWHIWEDSFGFPFIFDEDGKSIASMCGQVKNVKKPICHIEDFVFPERVLKNASLIAAAPEMYRMLEQLHGTLSKVPALQKEIKRVLKKARGEE